MTQLRDYQSSIAARPAAQYPVRLLMNHFSIGSIVVRLDSSDRIGQIVGTHPAGVLVDWNGNAITVELLAELDEVSPNK